MGESITEEIKAILFNDPEVKEKWDDLKQIDSFSDMLKSFKLIFFFIKKLVYSLEIIQSEFNVLNKDERIEYAAQTLDDLIKFSGWASIFELVDKKIFQIAVSMVVAALDDKFGSGSWNEIPAAVHSLDNQHHMLSKAKEIFEGTENI